MTRTTLAVIFLALGATSGAQELKPTVFHFDRPCTVEVRTRHGKDTGPWMEESVKGKDVQITRKSGEAFDVRGTAEGTYFTSYRAIVENQIPGDFNPDTIVLKEETRVDRMVDVTWVVIIAIVGFVGAGLVWRKRRVDQSGLETRLREAEEALARLETQGTVPIATEFD